MVFCYPTIFLGLGRSRISLPFHKGEVRSTERINDLIAMDHVIMKRLDLGFGVDSVASFLDI